MSYLSSGVVGPLYLPVMLWSADAAQYAGSPTCRPCNPEKFEMQSKTGHAHAVAAAPAGSPGQWAFGAGAKAITFVRPGG
jgi:hypothetical protein